MLGAVPGASFSATKTETIKTDVFPPQGIKEFKIAKGWRIFVDVTLGTAIVGLCWGYCKLRPNMQEPLGTRDWIMLLGLLLMIGILILGLIDVHKRRLIITSNHLISISVFTRRELAVNEIKGYRETDKYFAAEPNDTSKKSIKLSRAIHQRTRRFTDVSRELPAAHLRQWHTRHPVDATLSDPRVVPRLHDDAGTSPADHLIILV